MFSCWCRYALPALPILSAGRMAPDPDATEGRLPFAQLPKLVKTALVDGDEDNESDSGDSYYSDGDNDDVYLVDE